VINAPVHQTVSGARSIIGPHDHIGCGCQREME
jgi:hypothetical protein